MTSENLTHITGISVFSALCTFYKTIYNPICPVREIARELSYQIQLIHLKLKTPNKEHESSVPPPPPPTQIKIDKVGKAENGRESLGNDTKVS